MPIARHPILGMSPRWMVATVFVLVTATVRPLSGSEAAVTVPDSASQDSVGWIAGRVTNARNGDALQDASIVIDGTKFGDVSDSSGQYDIALPPGRYTIEAVWGPHRRTWKGVLVPAGVRITYNLSLDPESPRDNVEFDSILRFVQASRPVEVDIRRAGYSRILTKAWNVWVSGRGCYAIKQSHSSVEGDPIVHYLIIRDGDCLDVHDSRADQWGPKVVSTRGIPELRLVCQATPRRPPSGHARARWTRLLLVDDKGATLTGYYGP